MSLEDCSSALLFCPALPVPLRGAIVEVGPHYSSFCALLSAFFFFFFFFFIF